MQKPFQTYKGGKGAAGVHQAIINEIPPHFTYIEGCIGNGTVLRHKKEAALNIGLDLDDKVISKWIDLGFPLNFWFLKKSIFEFLKSKEFQRDWNKPGTFLFLDPPYLMSSRKRSDSIYKHEFTELDHERLIKAVLDLKCWVMITHYPCELYNNLLSDWRKIPFTSQNRIERTDEMMYCNYSEPMKLHDYSYLGEDSRQRERIRKKINRWVNKLSNLPTKEAMAIMAALEEINHIKKQQL